VGKPAQGGMAELNTQPDLQSMKESVVLRLIHRLKRKEQQLGLSAAETELLRAACAELDRRDEALPVVWGSSNWDIVVTGRRK